MTGLPDGSATDDAARAGDATRAEGSVERTAEDASPGGRVRGRHRGTPADAQRATRPATHDPAHRATRPAPPAESVLPRSADDSDVGWGARPDPDDDERLLRDVPPHWQ